MRIGSTRSERIEKFWIFHVLHMFVNYWHEVAQMCLLQFSPQSVLLLLTQTSDVLVVNPAGERRNKLTQKPRVLREEIIGSE